MLLVAAASRTLADAILSITCSTLTTDEFAGHSRPSEISLLARAHQALIVMLFSIVDIILRL